MSLRMYDDIIKIRKLDSNKEYFDEEYIPYYKCTTCKTRMYAPLKENQKCPVCGSIDSYEHRSDHSGLILKIKIILLSR